MKEKNKVGMKVTKISAQYIGMDMRVQIIERLILGRKAVSELHNIWWQKCIHTERKINVYNTVVNYIILYRAEAWRWA